MKQADCTYEAHLNFRKFSIPAGGERVLQLDCWSVFHVRNGTGFYLNLPIETRIGTRIGSPGRASFGWNHPRQPVGGAVTQCLQRRPGAFDRVDQYDGAGPARRGVVPKRKIASKSFRQAARSLKGWADSRRVENRMGCCSGWNCFSSLFK